MPRVADVGILAKALGSVSPGKPQTHEALTVIPLLGPAQVEPEWVTMAEAGNRARITTVGEAGHGSGLQVARRWPAGPPPQHDRARGVPERAHHPGVPPGGGTVALL